MYESLSSIVSNVFLCMDEINSHIWMPCSFGVFSTRSLYRSLGEMPRGGVPSCLLCIYTVLLLPQNKHLIRLEINLQ